MTDEQRITTVIEWTDTGTGEVIRASEAVRDSVVDATKKINDANDALKDLGAGIDEMPTTINVPPPMPIPFDTDEVKEVAQQLDKVGESAVDVGNASEMLYGALDSVIPGLGGVAESLFSLNPVAIAGTAAVAGITLAFAEIQRQAEETRKAIEAQIQADVDRALAQSTLDQRVNLALTGNKEARESIITDMAANASEVKNIADQMAEVNDQLAFQQKELERSREMGAGGWTLFNTATASIATLEEKSKSLNAQLETNSDNFLQLEEAAKKLDITQEELAAVHLAVAQGAEGAAVALEKVWTAGERFAAFGDSVGKAFDGIKGFGQDVLDYAEEVEKKKADAAKERMAAEERLLDINADLADVEKDRGAALADRYIEEQRAAELSKLNTQLEAAQAYDAAVAKNQKMAEIQQQGQAEQIAAQQEFMADQQKLLANYLKAEKEATEDYSLERVRKLEDLYNTLNDLSSKRDVAGFVNARRSGMTDIGRGDEDAGIAARRRREQYEQAAADQQAAYNKETMTRQAQLQQKLQQEAQAGQREVTQASIVQKQIADLRAQYAAQDLRARRAQEDATYRQTVDILNQKRNAELKITAGAAAGVISILSQMRDTILKTGSSLEQAAAKGVPKFHDGTPLITRGGLAILKEGESVLNPAETAQRLRSGGDRQMGPININMTVGEIATPSQVAAVESRIVNAIRRFSGSGI